MKKLVFVLLTMVMVIGTANLAHASKATYATDGLGRRCVLITEEDDDLYIFLYPERVEDDAIICHAVVYDHGKLSSYDDYPSKIGTIFDLNDDGTVSLVNVEKGGAE